MAPSDELLPAVDVVGRARERGVGHEMHGQRGDVGRPDDAPDRKRGAQLARGAHRADRRAATPTAAVSTKPGGDQIDADRRELERQVGDEGGLAAVTVDAMAMPSAGRRAPVPPMNTSVPPRPHLAGGVARDVEA